MWCLTLSGCSGIPHLCARTSHLYASIPSPDHLTSQGAVTLLYQDRMLTSHLLAPSHTQVSPHQPAGSSSFHYHRHHHHQHRLANTIGCIIKNLTPTLAFCFHVLALESNALARSMCRGS
ncbi:hypothetical protein LY76DRAFT_323701 [Colletotrichum caudatum]|nr:hypothetical protein LY76DRAFT_323701 [Colletotrichum caudatum]